MKFPNKNKQYYNKKDNTIWEIWPNEDFADGTVLLYEKTTGEDCTFTIDDFWKYFEVID